MKATPWMLMSDLSMNIWAVMALMNALSVSAVVHSINELPNESILIKEDSNGKFYQYYHGKWESLSTSLEGRLNIGCNQACRSLFGVNNTSHALYYASLPKSYKQQSDSLFANECQQNHNCQLTIVHSLKGVSIEN